MIYLKFHIDSVTAFSINDNKERVQDYVAPTRKDGSNIQYNLDQNMPVKIKSNIKDLIKLSEWYYNNLMISRGLR